MNYDNVLGCADRIREAGEILCDGDDWELKRVGMRLYGIQRRLRQIYHIRVDYAPVVQFAERFGIEDDAGA